MTPTAPTASPLSSPRRPRLTATLGLLAGTLGALACTGSPEPTVPLAADSPWPKFRGNAHQTGRTDYRPPSTGGVRWDFPTGKGIFSSPVIGADGTIYVGSADRTFYALNPDGTVRWTFLTGEIIDSAALLDDQGRVVFGSGDGVVYALDAATGAELWRFQADPPTTNNALINWFEGNVAIDSTGTLYVPCDNFFVYALDRATGQAVRRLKVRDQTWSSPAVDPATDRVFFGNNSLVADFGPNTYAFDASGRELWSIQAHDGSVAASPLLADGRMIVGSFDGYVRAYAMDTGVKLWEHATRDHIYASPAALSDGTIIQPSADGTVYALDPTTGARRWAFDTRSPLRSSPAVDGDDRIYLGSGEGRLFVLEPDGTLSWALRLVTDERKDLNSSPALGRDAIVLGAESGQVFSVPYGYCLRAEAATDPGCIRGPAEDLPTDGAHVYYTTQLGAVLDVAPAELDAHQTLAFSLFVRAAGDTVLTLIDSPTLTVDVTPPAAVTVAASGDRRFLTIVPTTRFTPGPDGRVSIRVRGDYLVNPERQGLRFSGGTRGGGFDQTFVFAVRPAPVEVFGFQVPAQPGEPSSTWEINRLAAPLPTMLPSYNQIGFDSLHYLVGVVEGSPDRFVTWVVGAKLATGENRTVVDPATRAMFTLDARYQDGLLALTNDAGFAVEVTGATLTFSQFRLSARLDRSGRTLETPRLLIGAICGNISLYGPFLRRLGLCNEQTDVLSAFGAALFTPITSQPSIDAGTVAFAVTDTAVTATITASALRADQHTLGILLVDATTGRPVSLDYGLVTSHETDPNGVVRTVTLAAARASLPASVRAYLMVDTTPAARATLTIR